MLEKNAILREMVGEAHTIYKIKCEPKVEKEMILLWLGFKISKGTAFMVGLGRLCMMMVKSESTERTAMEKDYGNGVNSAHGLKKAQSMIGGKYSGHVSSKLGTLLPRHRTSLGQLEGECFYKPSDCPKPTYSQLGRLILTLNSNVSQKKREGGIKMEKFVREFESSKIIEYYNCNITISIYYNDSDVEIDMDFAPWSLRLMIFGDLLLLINKYDLKYEIYNDNETILLQIDYDSENFKHIVGLMISEIEADIDWYLKH